MALPAPDQHPLVHVEGLRKSFGSHEVLKGIDLPVQKGEIVAMIGPSGSGKSTLSKVLWPDAVLPTNPWHHTASLLDSFPKELGVKEVVEILSSVGFSSPAATSLSTSARNLALCSASLSDFFFFGIT